MDPSRTTPPPDELVFADFVRLLARRWRLLLGAPLAAALLALAAALVWPRSYTAEVSFTPEQPSGGSLGSSISGALGSLSEGLGTLADLPGALPAGLSGGGANSPEFFASLLKSRELMVSTLESPFRDPDDPARRRTLLDIMKPRGSTPARRLGNARRKLTGKATVTADRRTGIITLTMTLRDPQLAADVANRMVDLLNVYNLERRQSSSREQRRFIAARVAEAEQELRTSENALTTFMLENRNYRGSPMLEERAARLGREARVRQELVLGLRRAFENARIAEIRDTPVLSTIDRAAPPDRPSSPRPVLWSVLAAVVGLGAAVAVTVSGAPRGHAAASHAVGDGVHGRGGRPQREGVEAIEPTPRADAWAAARRVSERP